MASEDIDRQQEIKMLKGKLAQLEEREAFLEQLEKLKWESSQARKHGCMSQSQSLYNRAWEMERDYNKRANRKDNMNITKEAILRTARSMGLRNSS